MPRPFTLFSCTKLPEGNGPFMLRNWLLFTLTVVHCIALTPALTFVIKQLSIVTLVQLDNWIPSLVEFCILHLVICTLLQLLRCMPVELPPFIESPLMVILLCPLKLIGAEAL